MWYLDTSVLIAAVTSEIGTIAATQFLEQLGPGEACISDLVFSECYAALAMKVRLRELDTAGRDLARQNLLEILPPPQDWLAIERPDFQHAARLCDDFATGLRAPDALHLAVAIRNGLIMVTLDRKLALAARASGHVAQIPM
jgi:uncharacterized protein